MVKLVDVNGFPSIMYAKTSGGALVFQINADSGSYFYETGAGFQSVGTAAVADNWHLFGATKASGTATPRGHKYVYDTHTYSHANAVDTMGDASAAVGSGGSVQFGRYGTEAEYANMHLAVAAVWDRVLTDAEFENLAFSLAHWHAAAPVGLWLFDQSATGQAVADLTGGGANQTALVGTAVSTVSVPVFGYGHEILIPHTVAASGATNAPAESAGATAVAETPAPAIAPVAAEAPVTGAAETPAPSIVVNAAEASATASATNPAASLNVNAAEAAAAATAPTPVPSVAVTAEGASASASANDATVSTAVNTNAPAEAAEATATAETASVAVAPIAADASATAAAEAAPSVAVNAEAVGVAAAANDATVSTAVQTNAAAEVAGATGSAEATISVQVNAETASATGAAQTPAPSVGAAAQHAAASAAADDATVTWAVDALAEAAEAAATAPDPSASVAVAAAAALADAVAPDATALTIIIVGSGAPIISTTISGRLVSSSASDPITSSGGYQ